MNFTKKPETIYQIYLVVLKVGLVMLIIYILRQVILIFLLLCNFKRKRIILDAEPDDSLREEQGRLESRHLHFSTVDHLFEFDATTDSLIKQKRTKVKLAPIANKRTAPNRTPLTSPKYGISKSLISRQLNEDQFQGSIIDEYSIESEPSESSLQALSESEQSVEFRVINENRMKRFKNRWSISLDELLVAKLMIFARFEFFPTLVHCTMYIRLMPNWPKVFIDFHITKCSLDLKRLNSLKMNFECSKHLQWWVTNYDSSKMLE